MERDGENYLMNLNVGTKLRVNLSAVGLGYVECVLYKSVDFRGSDGFIIRIEKGNFKDGLFLQLASNILSCLHGAGKVEFIPVLVEGRNPSEFARHCLMIDFQLSGVPSAYALLDKSEGAFTNLVQFSIVDKEEESGI